jgi:hypothetical protein
MQLHNLIVLTAIFFVCYSQKHMQKGTVLSIHMSGESACFPCLVHVKLRNTVRYMLLLNGDEKTCILNSVKFSGLAVYYQSGHSIDCWKVWPNTI